MSIIKVYMRVVTGSEYPVPIKTVNDHLGLNKYKVVEKKSWRKNNLPRRMKKHIRKNIKG